MSSSPEPLAIVGIGCRFPGGVQDPTSFWDLLQDGRDAIGPVPATRWDHGRYYGDDPDAPGRYHAAEAGFLDWDPATFDARFFGISPREGASLDPQQRVLLEVAWEAFEDAGAIPSALAGSRTGVFVGGFVLDFQVLQLSEENRRVISNHTGTGVTMAMLSNRIAHAFDLRGPAISMDTACSASLVALHTAARAIWAGDCDLALAGGVNLLLNPRTTIAMAKGRYLSPGSRCKAFDHRADGYVRAEGAGLLVLKPLGRARADGDRVYALVRGTAANQDGRTPGITVPRQESQEDVVRRALAQAGVGPERIDFIEAHGTGTAVGDPIEASALGTVLGGEREVPLRIGSVKTNVGHTEAAAGVAGVIKAALALHHRELPRSLHVEELNPAIPFEELNLSVCTEAAALPMGEAWAGVNGFGYGGTNAHVVLSTAPPVTSPGGGDTLPGTRPMVLPFSGRSSDARAARGADLCRWVSGRDLGVVARTSAQRRQRLAYAAAAVGTPAEITEALDAAGRGEAHEGLVQGEVRDGPLAFVYSGMGPQWWRMGRDLLAHEPVFRDAATRVDALFTEVAGWSLLEAMGADEASSRMSRTEVAQPANFLLQVALTEWLAEHGVRPDIVTGHSVGEITAAWTAGMLSLEDATRVTYHRSSLQQARAGTGGMLAVGLAREEVRARLRDDVEVAAVNSPAATTLAGPIEQLEALRVEFEAEGVFARTLRVEVPFHSQQMDPLREPLLEALAGLSPTTPETRLVSTVTGELVGDLRYDAAYWFRNVREPVAFLDAARALLARGVRRILEVGPHPVLTAALREVAAEEGVRVAVVPTLNRKVPEDLALARCLGQAWCHGVPVAWDRYQGPAAPTTRLPRYPWQREALWEEDEQARGSRLAPAPHPLLEPFEESPTAEAQLRLGAAAHPWIRDHEVGGTVVVPGATWIEGALALARHQVPEAQSLGLAQLRFEQATLVPDGDEIRAQIRADTRTDHLGIHVRSEDTWRRVASLRLRQDVPPPPDLDLDVVRARLSSAGDPAEVYRRLANRDLTYGPAFRSILGIERGDGELLVRLQAPRTGWLLDPCSLDGLFQAIVLLVDDHDGHDGAFLPYELEEFRWYGEAQGELIGHLRLDTVDAREVRADATLQDEGGRVVAELRGLVCRALPRSTGSRDHWWHAFEWVEVDLQGPRVEGSWAVVGGGPEGKGLAALVRELGGGARHVSGTEDVRDGEAILDLTALTGPATAGDDLAELACIRASETLQRLHRWRGAPRPRTVVVTRGARAVTEDEVPDLRVAADEGLLRTAYAAFPELHLLRLDLGADTSQEFLLEAALLAGDEDELALRSERVFAPRLRRRVRGTPRRTLERRDPENAFELVQDTRGRLDSFRWQATPRPDPGPGEVEVALRAVTLNFKDVVKSMNVISEAALAGTFFGDTLGLDWSGVVTRVGEGVDEYAPGQEVCGAAPHSFRSHVVAPPLYLGPTPPGTTLPEAANVITWLTAWYALEHLARLEAGERILVHSGTGGLGQAAIQIARARGAEVFATAGSPERRELLAELGAAGVGASRSAGFVDAVESWTDGRGVDVVLNSLPGELLHRSVECLAPYGRFIELGKRDISANEPLDLRPFHRNLSFHALDLDQMFEDRPELCRRLLDEVTEGFACGDLKPLPTTTFPASRVEEAFRHMAQAKHVGKIAVTFEDPELEVSRDAGAGPRLGDTWVVTGGLGGVGLETARWLVDRGVRNLVLLGRRGLDTPGAREAIAALETRGAAVMGLAVDVTDKEALGAALDQAAAEFPPVTGIIHAAMVLRDQLLESLDEDTLQAVLAPKVRGAWNLHALAASRDLPLRAFVLYSSVTALTGPLGQANYVAANTFLDALASFRRAQGLPGVAVNWGVFAEAGVVARQAGGHVDEHLRKLGMTGFRTADAMEALGELLDWDDAAQVGVFDADWDQWARMSAQAAASPRYQELRGSGDRIDGTRNRYRDGLRAKDDVERQEAVVDDLARVVGRVLRLAPDRVPRDVPLDAIGVDSIMVVEIVTAVAEATGETLTAMEATSSPSLEALGVRILERLDLPEASDG